MVFSVLYDFFIINLHDIFMIECQVSLNYLFSVHVLIGMFVSLIYILYIYIYTVDILWYLLMYILYRYIPVIWLLYHICIIYIYMIYIYISYGTVFFQGTKPGIASWPRRILTWRSASCWTRSYDPAAGPWRSLDGTGKNSDGKHPFLVG